MKINTACLIIFLCAICASGQSKSTDPCSTNFLNAQIHGFSLGMTKDSVSKTLDGLKWENQINNTETAKVSTFKDKQRFKGVRQIEFRVFDNVLYQILVAYDNTLQSTNLVTFTGDISKSWKIKDKWTGAGLFMILDCKERFAMFTGLKELVLSDSITSEQISKNEKAKQKPFNRKIKIDEMKVKLLNRITSQPEQRIKN